MADIQTSVKSKGRRQHKSARVDLTPMVDLGFLLITFFVFTTSLASQQAMNIFVPESDTDLPIPASGAVTILPDSSGFWYYEHFLPTQKKDLLFYDASRLDLLRVRLMQIKHGLTAANGNDDKMMVTIKPTIGAQFSQIIDALDEMTICGIRRYAISEPSDGEMNLLNQ